MPSGAIGELSPARPRPPELKPTARLHYRPDVDGLRAVAILAVIGFHAFPDAVKGGFIGVDIFFVISGFLITKLLLGSMRRGQFTFKEFYSRRIQRIFPSLITVLLGSLLLGSLALLPNEFKQLGRHVVGGSAFLSNFLLFSENGYFDNAADTKPLLHLWSLGVEEQFYILFPLVLWLAWKRRFNIPKVLGAIALVSFGLNLFMAKSTPAADYYLPQARFWELMIGGLLAAWPPATVGTVRENLQSLLGVGLLVLGALVISKDQAFPGWLALVPTAGAALIILGGPQAWVNRRILSTRVFVWIGLISYPLYLWHWVLLSFARIIGSATPPWPMRLWTVAGSFALAWLTYLLVEGPLRSARRRQAKVIGLIVAMAAVGAFGQYVRKQDGLPFSRVAKMNPGFDSGADGGSQGFTVDGCGLLPAEQEWIPNCLKDAREDPVLALVGDSKAQAIFDGLVRTSRQGHRWLYVGGNGKNGAVVPVLSKNWIYDSYAIPSKTALDAVLRNKKIQTVLLVAASRAIFHLKNDHSIEDLPGSPNAETALDGMTKYVDPIVSSGKRVILLVDNPTFPGSMDCLSRKTSIPALNAALGLRDNPACTIPLERQRRLSANYRKVLRQVAARHPSSVFVFDPTDILCDTQAGVCGPFKNGRLLYGYTDHISDYAAGLIGEKLNAFILLHS